jgi:ribosomal protein L37AE/L43A
MDFPETAPDFHSRFSNELACRQYIAALRWPAGFQCPECKGTQFWMTARGLYHCQSCDHQASITAGTLFMDTHMPLRFWFEAMWEITSQKYGASALGLQRVLGLGSYRTAWNLLHKLRRAMVRPGRDQLQGVVEVDEIYIGGPRPKYEGHADKALVFVAVEDKGGKKLGRIRLLRIADRSGASLNEAISRLIAKGSQVRTDDYCAYSRVKHLGYEHQVIESSPTGPKNLLPLANRVASLLKRWLLGTHQGSVARTHLDYYLDEFTFRFNRRTSHSRGLLFYRLVSQAVQLEPQPGKTLVGGRGEIEPPQ